MQTGLRSAMGIVKVTLFGSESTGKTILAQQLADYFQTSWVPEYARLYQEKHNRLLTYRDVTPIARGQMQLEKYYASKVKNLLICDTDILETKVYSEAYYNRYPAWVSTQIPNSYADLYLLTDIDLPWEPDGVRDRPKEREAMHHRFEQELIDRKLPFVRISGSLESRFQKARLAVSESIIS